MSKMSKLMKNPILFFKDRKKNITKKEEPVAKSPIAKKPVAKKAVAKKPVVKEVAVKKPVAKKPVTKKEPEVIETIKHVLSTVINEIPVANASLMHHEVALYFAGSIGNMYQVEQWLGTLNVLDEKKKLLVIVRSKEVYDWIRENTHFVVVFCRTIADLTKVYEDNNLKCILYVNHAFKNFQSLIVGDAMHVHINHGESDKTSTITNQSKGYDYVFIVGDAGYDKYNLNLIKKNMANFIQVGRPQLDHIADIAPIEEGKLIIEGTPLGMAKDVGKTRKKTDNTTVAQKKKVILYAPTWEGTHDSMNFTSLNDYGMSLVQQLTNHPNYYLLYKPHPNTGSRDAACKGINEAIIKLLNKHNGGETILGGDINSLYKHIDLAIFDNSAVAIDYLQVDKPMIMTDMFHRVKDRKSKPTITKAARMLSVVDAYSIPMIVSEEIEKDTLKVMRNKIKHYFLGNFDYEKKESTDKFVSSVLEIIEERDNLVTQLAILNDKAKPIT
ncbi:MAG TPA: hypothetical protein EYG82_03850 [Sulfurovum sp.]|nr:hypothetical protein [Sulfurovum sp.]